MLSISHPLADGILAFIIVNGFFENVIFAIITGMPTMLWILALSWLLLKDDPLVNTETGELRATDLSKGSLRFSQ